MINFTVKRGPLTRFNLFFISFILISIICTSGCVDIGVGMGWVGLFDMVSVNDTKGTGKEQVAFYNDDSLYITDFKGKNYLKVTEKEIDETAISLSEEGLFYTEKSGDVCTLNLYKDGEGSTKLLQESNIIRIPIYKEKISYVVIPEEDVPVGNINIYDKETSQVYVLLENAYYDYEWLKNSEKIVAITARNVNEGTFDGSVVIKDINDLSEEVIFTGVFEIKKDYIDIRPDGSVIFSSEGKIQTYDIKSRELLEWQGPSGYDYRLPPSVNSGLKGYVLAKVKSMDEGWAGQLYLVGPESGFIRIPAWPVWMNGPFVVCIDLESLIIFNLETNEIVDIIKKMP